MKKIHLIMAVWGEGYLDLFLNLSLPTQLSPGNLPYIGSIPGVVYKIYTTLQGAAYLEKSPVFQKLLRIVDTRIITVDRLDSDDKFSPLMAFHNRAIMEASADNASLIFLSPDFIMADGTLKKLIDIRKAGYRTVLTLTLRLIREEAEKELGRFFDKNTFSINLTPREFIGACFKHLHPIEKSYYWGDNFSSFPIHAYWPIDQEGLIARCYYLHPLLIDPLVKYTLPKITIDADYVDISCSNPDYIYIVQDSDELCCFEVTEGSVGDANATKMPTPADERAYAKWAVVHANPVFESILHHIYFQIPIRIHSGPFTKKWKKFDRRSHRRARRIRFWTILFRRHRSFSDAIDFYLSTNIKMQTFNVHGSSHYETGDKRAREGYKVDYYRYQSIKDWGQAESNQIGQRWRWIDSHTGSTVVIKKKISGHNTIETLIHTALGDSLYKLEVSIDNQPALNQRIVREGEKFFHICDFPNRKVGHETSITFKVINPDDDDRLAVSFSIIRHQPFKKIQIAYLELKNRFKRKIKAFIGYSNA